MTQGSPTHHLIDPELLPALEMLPALEFNAEMLPAIRGGMASMAAAPVELPVAPVEKSIQGPDGPMEVFWYDPQRRGELGIE